MRVPPVQKSPCIQTLSDDTQHGAVYQTIDTGHTTPVSFSSVMPLLQGVNTQSITRSAVSVISSLASPFSSVCDILSSLKCQHTEHHPFSSVCDILSTLKCQHTEHHPSLQQSR